MLPKFGGQRPPKARIRPHHMIYLLSGTLMFSLITVLLLLFGQRAVDANEEIRAADEMYVPASNSLANLVVIAPVAAVPQGTKLSNIEFREMFWPRNEVPEGAVRDMHVLRTMYAKVGLPANQPIVRGNLSVTPPVGGVAELIPPGHRAVTIEVDATAGVEGWATPGAHVDVLLTYFDDEDKLNKTRVAVEDAVVLSYNGKTKKASELDIGRAFSTSTVTLAVAATEALKIQTARAMGRISLILRNSQDPTSVGKGTFASNEWERTKTSKKAPKYKSKAFASYSNGTGEKREFMLGPDSRWWEVPNN